MEATPSLNSKDVVEDQMKAMTELLGEMKALKLLLPLPLIVGKYVVSVYN